MTVQRYFHKANAQEALRIFNSTVCPSLLHLRRVDTAALAAQALEDSLTIAALKADSIAAFNLANASENAACFN